jgi:hypothetical protein
MRALGLGLLALVTSACGADDETSSWSYGATTDGGSDAHPLDAPDDVAVPDGPLDAPADVVPDGSAAGSGWIGAACGSAENCAYEGATCLVDDFPGGMCSLSCEGICPDSDQAGDPVTFCIAWPDASAQGMCFPRCDWHLFPADGCRLGYVCRWRERLGEGGFVRETCVPDDGTWETACVGDEVRQPNVGIEAPAGLDGCPEGMAPTWTGQTCIDRWEAHLVELLDDGSTAPWSPYHTPAGAAVRAVSAPGAVPQGYVSGLEAEAACVEAGKRLCTRDEWESACMGPASDTYPYGDVRAPGVCNDARAAHPAVEYFGTTEDWIWSELGHPCINQLENGLARTGQYAGCVTGDDVFDMMGNLHEWIDDPDGTFKGGFYVDTKLNGEGCLYTTTAHGVSHWDYSTGFRCCADR